MKTKQVNIKGFPLELYRRLERFAAKHRRSVTQEILTAIEFYLRKQDEEDNTKQ